MRFKTLSVLIESDEPPRERRLFRAGVNHTDQGNFIFDEIAARAVMAAWKRWGVDLIVDLQHLSLDKNAIIQRPDAADARGHFKLEVRDGELWAVDMTWNPDGDRRLREKTQRYLSPAFDVDADGRIVEVINAALVSMPGTYHPQALIAASRDFGNLAPAERAAIYLQRVRSKASA